MMITSRDDEDLMASSLNDDIERKDDEERQSPACSLRQRRVSLTDNDV